MSIKTQFPALLEQLPQVLSWLRNHLQQVGFVKKEILRLELVLEEAFVNCVQHAYRNQGGVVELTFQVIPSSHVEISIADFAPPFNPLQQAPEVDTDQALEEREVGGLGIFFMQKCVDDIRYTRRKDGNTLLFIKRFSQTQ
ncbi:MAG: ATP-binding protein [Chlamydiia bacterium]|nr:ATP-binding protein [Chlamydiia bacterium]